MLKSKVIHPHKPESDEVVSCSEGDIVAFQRKESSFLGWIWCTDDHGRQAWVPEAYVSISGENCRFVRDYNSRELEAQEGETVSILEVVSGWAWVLNERDEKGWVPLKCLAPSVYGDTPR